MILLNFINRTVFIKCLSAEYLGVNGLFTNIITILSLAELGFGEAIVYSMYKPLAGHDDYKLKSLMDLYASIYKIIGCVVGVLGILVIPFLDVLIKDKPNIPNITIIYLLFLLNSVSSYFFTYKRSIIIADQRRYIYSKYQLVFALIKVAAQIIILYLTRNFIIYLLIQILCTLAENISISLCANKLYPFLKSKEKLKLAVEEKNTIFTNVKALIIYKIGSVALDGTGNLIISAFVGVISVGKLSNYTLIIGSVAMLLTQIVSSITASVGNFIAKEGEDRQIYLFNVVNFTHFILYSICSVCLLFLLTPFVSLWVGNAYVLDNTTTIIIVLNFYINGMMNPVWTFRGTMGLFVYGRYRPLISALINLVVSIFLAKLMGLPGVLLGTTITRLATNVWFDPLIIYKYGFKKSVFKYYIKYIAYFAILLFCTMLVYLATMSFSSNTWISLLGLLAICLIITTAILYAIFHKTEEYKYLYNNTIKSLLHHGK